MSHRAITLENFWCLNVISNPSNGLMRANVVSSNIVDINPEIQPTSEMSSAELNVPELRFKSPLLNGSLG